MTTQPEKLEKLDHLVEHIKATGPRNDVEQAVLDLHSMLVDGCWYLARTGAMHLSSAAAPESISGSCERAIGSHYRYAGQYVLGAREPVAGPDWVLRRRDLSTWYRYFD